MLVQRARAADNSCTIEYGLIAGPQHQHSFDTRTDRPERLGAPASEFFSDVCGLLFVAALVLSVGTSTVVAKSSQRPTASNSCHPPVRRRSSQNPRSLRGHQGVRQQPVLGIPRRHRLGRTPFARSGVSSWKWKDNGLTLELRIRDGLQVPRRHASRQLVHQEHSARGVQESRPGLSVIRAWRASKRSRITASRSGFPGPRRCSSPTCRMPRSRSKIRAKADIGLGPYRLLERGPKTRLPAFDSTTIAESPRSIPSKSRNSRSSARRGPH